MKTSKIGIVSAAILMVMAGVGFGIAQAGGDQLDNRAWTLEKWISEYPNDEVATLAADDIQLSSAGQEFVPEDNWSGTDWQARGAIETGSLPDESNVAYSSKIATEEDVYQGSGFIDMGGNE